MLLLTDRELLTFLKSFLLFFFSNLTLVRHGRGMFLKFFQNMKVQSDALEVPLIFQLLHFIFRASSCESSTE